MRIALLCPVVNMISIGDERLHSPRLIARYLEWLRRCRNLDASASKRLPDD